MIKLLDSDYPALMQPFADFCQQQGWQVRLDIVNPHYCQLFVAETDLLQVQTALELYSREPSHPRYQAAAWDKAQPGLSYGQGSDGHLLRSIWQHTGRVTKMLVVSCVLAYLWLLVWPQTALQSLMFFTAWPQGADLLSFRWLSPILLHFSGAHLLMNLSVLMMFGGLIERYHGARALLALTVVCGVSANLAQYLLAGPMFGGFSGVGYGIIGFYFLMAKRAPALNYPLAKANFAVAVAFMLFGFADLLWVNTANWAHLIGMLAGLVVAAIWPIKPATR